MTKKIKTLSSFRRFLYKKGSKRNWNLLDDELLKLFLNVLANIVNKNINVKPKLLDRMALYKRDFRKLTNTSHDLQAKRKFLNSKQKGGSLNQKGGIFPIFAALIPLLTAAAPFLAKAAIGIGAASAAGATGAAVSHKLQNG